MNPVNGLNRKRFCLVFLFCLLSIPFCVDASNTWTVNKNVYTDKAMYFPATPAVIYVYVQNNLGFPVNGSINLSVKNIYDEVHTDSQSISLAAGNSQTYQFNWVVPAETFKGYSIDVDVLNGASVVIRYGGAIDVSSDWTQSPRYGFLSDYSETETSALSDSVVAEMAKYHINGIQFYDWMYKHQDVLKKVGGVYADTWLDMSGRVLSLTTIKNRVQSAKTRNMWTLGYDLIYGELTNIDSPSLLVNYGQFVNSGDINPDSNPLAFWGKTIWLMNPGDANWKDTIYTEYREAVSEVGFEGIHLDELGDRGTRYDTLGGVINFTSAIPSFINGTKSSIRTVDPTAKVIFNAVDGWPPLQQVAVSDEDVIYNEVWSETTYNELRNLIINAKKWAPQKQVVLPAYMNKYQANNLTYMDSPSVLLTDAVIFANGAFHLELGEMHTMLSTEYFPDHDPGMDTSLVLKLFDYYDFIVRYENLLYENPTDITSSAVAWTSLAEGLSKTGEAGKVWNIIRTSQDDIMIHLINLIGVDNDWRDTTLPPTPKTGFDYKYYTNESVAGVYFASPDTANGRLSTLSYYTGHDEPYGNYVYIQNIPQLEYWDMIIVKTGTPSTPSSSSLQFRTYIPWYTAAVDGTIDSGYGIAVASDQENGTNGQANSPMDMMNLYMSHDTDNVYVCFTINKNVSTFSDSWGKYVITIDTDGLNNSGADSPAWSRAVTYSNPHRPEYEIISWVNFLPFETTDIQRWKYSSGGWNNVGTVSNAAMDSSASLSVLEYKIAKTDIGGLKSAKLWVEVWATGGSSTDNAQDGINNPRDDANPGNWTTNTPLKLSTFCHFVPARIGGLDVQNIQNSLKLTWNTAELQGFSRYDIFRSTAAFHDVSNMSPVKRIYNQSQNSYTDTSLVPGDTLYYSVVAVNTLGDSDTVVYRWEAERGIIGKGAAIDKDHPDFSGDAFCDQFDNDEVNDWVEHTANLADAGYYNLVFRYSAGNLTTYARLDINDVEIAWPQLSQTANWDTWLTVSKSVWLNSGDNKVKFGFETGNDAFNYDYFEMDNPAGYVAGNIVINEILPDSLNDSSGVDADEWVELYNAADTSIDIGSWHIIDYDGEIYTFPSGIILPAYNWVVVHFQSGTNNLDFSDSVAHLFSNGFPSDDMFTPADQCGLYDDAWQIIDFVAFGLDANADSDAVSAGIWNNDDYFNYTPGTDKSIYLFPDGNDNNSSADWNAASQSGRASEGGTNDGMDVVDTSVGSLFFMLPDWSAPLPVDSYAVINDTLYIQMQNDTGNSSEIDYVQVFMKSTSDTYGIAVTLKETSINSNILRGVAAIKNISLSSMDQIGGNYGDSIVIQDYEGPDMFDSIMILNSFIVSGTVTLEGVSFADNGGCTVWIYDGSGTYTGTSQQPGGTFAISGVLNGTYNIRFKEYHHLAQTYYNAVVVSGSDTDAGTFGPLLAGDANNNNRINVFDSTIIKLAIDSNGSIFGMEGDINLDGFWTSADLNLVRNNFGMIGDDW